MPSIPRRRPARGVMVVLGVLALLAPLASSTTAHALAPTTQNSHSAAAPDVSTRDVVYHGVRVQVPADWPVVDLDRSPGYCMRQDVDAVYLGAAPAQQSCPARLVGRGSTIWLAPREAPSDALVGTPKVAKVGRMTASVREDADDRTQVVRPSGASVVVHGSWGADRTPVQRALGTLAPAPGVADTAGTAVARRMTSAAQPAPGGAKPMTEQVTPTAVSPSQRFTGMTFDTCAAPSTGTMSAWLRSPYRGVGIYIGGSNRACGYGNLSSSWVSQVTQMGYGLQPTYVGPQAPCVASSANLEKIDPATATVTGRSNAQDAVQKAKALGLPTSTPIFNDIEHYDPSDSACSRAVVTYLTAWTQEIRRLGFTSGVYGSPTSVMRDLSRCISGVTPGCVAPDQVWFARWNDLQSVTSQSSSPEFKDSYWPGARLHQYRGDFTETWNGVSIAIDANWVDARLGGRATYVSYGPDATGPGGPDFVFGGSMRYWRTNSGSGVAGVSYWTGPTTGSVDSNTASWSPDLAAGSYDVAASVPETNASAVVRYQVRDADGLHLVTRDQSATSGYVALGRFRATSTTPVRVVLGDYQPAASAGTRIGVNAMRFRRVAALPGAPTQVRAEAGDGRATVRWGPAPDNGSAVTSYTITASPGGSSRVVSGAARAAYMDGLSNGTTYRFTVRAHSSQGAGATSAATTPVVPMTATRTAAVRPTRLVDTRIGTPSNSRATALPAGGSMTVKVAGATGSPVPAGATSAWLNLSTPGHSADGWISVAPAAGESALTRYVDHGTPAAGMTHTRLSSSGTVVVTNRSGRPLTLLVDVLAYGAPGGTGGTWQPVAATRVADTQAGGTSSNRRTPLQPGETASFPVAGTGSPVPAGSDSVSVMVTATSTGARGWLTVNRARTSTTVMVDRGGSSSNLVLARPDATGRIEVTNRSALPMHVALETVGHTTSSATGLWRATVDTRLLDTRVGTALSARKTPLTPGESVAVPTTGRVGTPLPAGTTAAALNLSVYSATGSGVVELSDGAGGIVRVPVAPGRLASTMVPSRLVSGGTVRVTNRTSGAVGLLLGVQGYRGD